MMQLFLKPLVLYREEYLNPSLQIPRHPVRAAAIILRFLIILKIEYPAVLEIITDYGSDSDILTDSRYTHLKGAYPSHYQLYLHSCATGLIQCPYYIGIAQ